MAFYLRRTDQSVAEVAVELDGVWECVLAAIFEPAVWNARVVAVDCCKENRSVRKKTTRCCKMEWIGVATEVCACECGCTSSVTCLRVCVLHTSTLGLDAVPVAVVHAAQGGVADQLVALVAVEDDGRAEPRIAQLDSSVARRERWVALYLCKKHGKLYDFFSETVSSLDSPLSLLFVDSLHGLLKSHTLCAYSDLSTTMVSPKNLKM